MVEKLFRLGISGDASYINWNGNRGNVKLLSAVKKKKLKRKIVNRESWVQPIIIFYNFFFVN